jgi:hypothetical protein
MSVKKFYKIDTSFSEFSNLNVRFRFLLGSSLEEILQVMHLSLSVDDKGVK